MPGRGVISNRWKRTCRTFPIPGNPGFSFSPWRPAWRPRVSASPCLRVFLVAAFALAAASAPARVYWLGSGGETGGVLSADPAWSRAYATMVRINGGRGGLEVWNARFSMDETVEALRTKFNRAGGAFWASGSGELMWAIASDGERVFRFLLSAGEGPRQCHVHQLSQSFEDFKASLQAPAEHLLKAAPAFPGSTEKSFLASDATKTQLASSFAAAPQGEIHDFYAAQLPAAGWSPVFQPGKGLDIYLKGNEVILLSTETAGESGDSLIMLLHKPLSSGERK